MAARKKKQGYKARQDESLGARRGARTRLKEKVTPAGRRAMASGPRRAAGGTKFGLSGTSRTRKKAPSRRRKV